MSEPAAPDSPPTPALPSADPVPARRPARAARRVQARWRRGAKRRGELVTVFLGVYAAFLLNDFQLRRQERLRREQILAWMEADYQESLESVRRERMEVKRYAEEFSRQVDAGEMPPLHVFSFTSDYDPSDVAGVLGSGGFNLLEVETVREVKDIESTLRQMVVLARHDQQLSDALVLPNIEKDRSVFYDPATRKLRPTYRWYAVFVESGVKSYDTLLSKLEKLLAQIRAERKRNR